MTMHPRVESLIVATASHDPAILAANLAASPPIAAGRIGLHVERGAPSAAVAYNRALEATGADVVVFAHHDVWLPEGWDRLLAARLAVLAAVDPGWAVAGAFGIGLDGAGYGPVWSTSLSQIVGRVALAPVPVQSLDECLIVLRRASGLRFDEGLPNFHLYGTDIVQAARTRGLGAWALPLPLIHNDGYKDALGEDFAAPFRYMRRKWRAALPIRTPVITLAWHGLHLVRQNRRAARDRSFRRAMAAPTATPPAEWARLCGWSDLGPSAAG
jgi:glycosyltransferase involved in cell wall biosynthesis